MTYKGVIKKSRTLDWSAILLLFGILEMNLPLLKENLGSYYGWVFIGVAVITGYLRVKTTGPVGEK